MNARVIMEVVNRFVAIPLEHMNANATLDTL